MTSGDFADLFSIQQEFLVLKKINQKIQKLSNLDEKNFFQQLNKIQSCLDSYYSFLQNNGLYNSVVDSINEIFDLLFQKESFNIIKKKVVELNSSLKEQIEQTLQLFDQIHNLLIKIQQKKKIYI